MTRKNDGGLAFPNTITSLSEGDRDFPHEFGLGGMTLRQWYAGQAAMGRIATYGADERCEPKHVAEFAFEVADALIAEGKKDD